MSERPTPETERVKGALHTNWDDLLNHARRLERERDEAREAADAMERAGAEQARRADENREWALRVERERDEAREQLSAAKHFLEKYIAERDEARIAIIATLEENRHLADGDDCTLAKLKSVVPEWK